MKKITFIGLLFLFIETKELCETRAKPAKQSMKWQVSYKAQIDPPHYNTAMTTTVYISQIFSSTM